MTASTAHRFAGTRVQVTALVVGMVFLLVGVAGFIPGLTHHIEHLAGYGAESEALLMGVFRVSVLHNAVHLLYGVAGVLAAVRPVPARAYLFWGGVVYIAVWVYGLFAAGHESANFLPVNAADNWLHLVLGVGMILLGLFMGRDRESRGVASAPHT